MNNDDDNDINNSNENRQINNNSINKIKNNNNIINDDDMKYPNNNNNGMINIVNKIDKIDINAQTIETKEQLLTNSTLDLENKDSDYKDDPNKGEKGSKTMDKWYF